MDLKERSIWKNFGFALAATPAVAFVGLIILTVVGAIDDAISKIQLAGYWWLILIISYILSLIYFFTEPRIRINFERKKVLNALILYYEEQLEITGKKQPSNNEIESVKEMLLERLKIWAWYDQNLWSNYYPNEQYSKYLFSMVDNFIVYYQNELSKYEKK